MKPKVTDNQITTFAAGMFLCKRIPDGYCDEWDDDAREEFIAEHVCETYEYYDPMYVRALIDDYAMAVEHFLVKEVGVEVVI